MENKLKPEHQELINELIRQNLEEMERKSPTMKCDPVILKQAKELIKEYGKGDLI